MAELKNKMFNYKNDIDVGKFENYSYEQLMSLVNPYKFYFEIDNKQELLQDLQAVHIKDCESKNEQYSPCKYRKFNGGTMGFTKFEANPSVEFNSKIGDSYEFMKACFNKFFPFIVFEFVIHESNHIFQINAINSGDFSKLQPESKIGALYQKLMDNINKQYNSDKFCKDETKNILLSNFFDIDDLVFDIRKSTNESFFYGNEPCEIAARDYTCQECAKLLNLPNLSTEIKRLFSAFIQEQARDSVYHAYDEKTSNFNFFLNILKADLLTDYPNVKQAKQELCDYVDGVFQGLGLRTINQVDNDLYSGAERITKKLLARAKIINSKIENNTEVNSKLEAEAEKLADSYDRMVDNLFFKRIDDYKQLERQYFELFPILQNQKKTIMKTRKREELLGDKNTVEGVLYENDFIIKKR